MSRREIKDEVSLDALIPKYKEAKDNENKYKKEASGLNETIKQKFKEMNKDEYVVEGIRASVTYEPREDFNELQAIEILRQKLPNDMFEAIVKTKEYIDDDALERAIYLKQVDAKILAPATTPLPPKVTLRLGKAK